MLPPKKKKIGEGDEEKIAHATGMEVTFNEAEGEIVKI